MTTIPVSRVTVHNVSMMLTIAGDKWPTGDVDVDFNSLTERDADAMVAGLRVDSMRLDRFDEECELAVSKAAMDLSTYKAQLDSLTTLNASNDMLKALASCKWRRTQ